MTATMDEAMRDYVRLYMGQCEAKGTRADVTPQMIAALELLREETRVEEGGGGMCGLVTEELAHNLGWDRLAVSYVSEAGEVITCGHFVSLLSDGTIVDPTADQFGEGNSVVILSPGDPGYGRYRPEFYPDFNPGTHPVDLTGWVPSWTGEMDMDAEARLRKERGFGWWVEDVSSLRRYCARQLELCRAKGAFFNYDVYIERNIADLDARSPLTHREALMA